MKRLLFVIIGLLFISSAVYADLRHYAFSYPYRTALAGQKEIEVYTDYLTIDNSYKLVNQYELEYGITDNWMASVYGVFSSSNVRSYEYVQTKLSTRYRIGEEGQYFIDPALYLEYKADVDGGSEVEVKQILSKDIGEYNVTVNLKAEKPLINTTEWETGYSLGTSKSLSAGLRCGIEARGSFEGKDSVQYIGPSIAWIYGQLKINLVAGIGSTSSSQTYYFRNIISFDF